MGWLALDRHRSPVRAFRALWRRHGRQSRRRLVQHLVVRGRLRLFRHRHGAPRTPRRPGPRPRHSKGCGGAAEAVVSQGAGHVLWRYRAHPRGDCRRLPPAGRRAAGDRWRDALPSGRAALAAGRPSGARLFAGHRIPPAGCVERLSREEAGGRPPVHRRRGPRRRPMDRPRVRRGSSPAVASACWRPALATRTWAPSSFRFLLIPGPPNSNGATGSRMRPAGSRRSRIRSPTDSASRGRVSRFARFASAGSRYPDDRQQRQHVPPTPRASAPLSRFRILHRGQPLDGGGEAAAVAVVGGERTALLVERLEDGQPDGCAFITRRRRTPHGRANRSLQRCRWNCSR